MSLRANLTSSVFTLSRRAFLASIPLATTANLVWCKQEPEQEKQTAKALVELSSLVWWDLAHYKVDRQLQAAIELQALGKELACEVLSSFTKNLQADESHHLHREESLIALARMLFVNRSDGEFRRARIGAPDFLGAAASFEESDLITWPLEPIEMIDGIPFLITSGYMLFGQAESAYNYIAYCRENCDWNGFRFEMKTDAQKQGALRKLLASPKWKRELTTWDKEFFSAQIR